MANLFMLESRFIYGTTYKLTGFYFGINFIPLAVPEEKGLKTNNKVILRVPLSSF